MTHRLVIAALLAVAAAGCGSTAPVSPDEYHEADSSGGTYVLWWRSDPSPIRVGEPFSVMVTVFDMRGRQVIEEPTVQVTARMPNHDRWMEAEPTVKRAFRGQYIAEGLLFDMKGVWELYFDLSSEGITERVEFELLIE
jgi:hypothetical protein